MKVPRVLLVDDNDEIRTVLGRLLRTFDFEIAGEAADGYDALTQAARLAPDVILLDVTMPRLSGLGALPALRDCVPSAVIIVVTNHESPAYREEALRLGADAFVLKLQAPFDLVPAIRDALSAQQNRA